MSVLLQCTSLLNRLNNVNAVLTTPNVRLLTKLKVVNLAAVVSLTAMICSYTATVRPPSCPNAPVSKYDSKADTRIGKKAETKRGTYSTHDWLLCDTQNSTWRWPPWRSTNQGHQRWPGCSLLLRRQKHKDVERLRRSAVSQYYYSLLYLNGDRNNVISDNMYHNIIFV